MTERAYAVECARRALDRAVWEPTLAVGWATLDVAHRHEIGQATDEELLAARRAAWAAAEVSVSPVAKAALCAAAEAAAENSTWAARYAAAYGQQAAALAVGSAASLHSPLRAAAKAAEAQWQAALTHEGAETCASTSS
jgi:hypothetical protein